MKFVVLVKEEAKIEIADAFDWYEEKLNGLGDRFLSSLKNSFKRINQNPFLYQERFNGFRCAPVHSFPYLIIFQIFDGEIVVFSVFNTNQNPAIFNRV